MLSLYDVTVPVFLRSLSNLDALLQKGADFFSAEGRPESALTGARLIKDMAPLTGQIQRASDTAKGVAVRVGGAENIPLADAEQSIADLRQRIARTREILLAVTRESFDGKEDIPIEVKTPQSALLFDGRSYVLDFALPNFFFHVATAYALLRAAGVPIGKADYLGPIARR